MVLDVEPELVEPRVEVPLEAPGWDPPAAFAPCVPRCGVTGVVVPADFVEAPFVEAPFVGVPAGLELFPGRIALSVAADVEPAGAERTRDASLASGPAPAALALGVALGSSAAPLAPAVGAIDSSLIASRDRSLNTGPAEVEPVSPDAVSKSITVTETCGRSAGRNPAKVVTW